MVTDYLLTAIGGWLAWRLRRRVAADNTAARWWGSALALAAVSAFVGGSYHGFGPILPAPVAGTIWVLTLWILGLVAAAMSSSLVHELVASERRRPWLIMVGLKFGLFAAFAVVHPDFLVAITDYGLALVAWMVAALVCRRPWRGWMLAAIGLSVLAAVVQQARLGLSVHFNYNDVYHVIQAVALYFFYRGAQTVGATGRS
jgi:hypothetical protein